MDILQWLRWHKMLINVYFSEYGFSKDVQWIKKSKKYNLTGITFFIVSSITGQSFVSQITVIQLYTVTKITIEDWTAQRRIIFVFITILF